MTDADDRARTLCEWYWKELLRLDPLLASAVGDERYDAELPDPSPDGIAERERIHGSLLSRSKRLGRESLEPDSRASLDIAEATARDGLTSVQLRLDRLHHVDHLYGPVALPARIADVARLETPAQTGRYLKRLRAIPRYIDAVIDQMRATQDERGVTSPRPVVRRVLDQLGRLLTTPSHSWPLLRPIAENEQRDRADAVEVIEKVVVPAFHRYVDATREYAPFARSEIGLAGIARGSDVYGASLERWVTHPLDPHEIHMRGREELARLETERREILARLGAEDEVAALETYHSAKRERVDSRSGVLELVRRYVDRGWEAARRFIDRVPSANCEVRLVDEFREDDYPGAAYEPAAGRRPGRYFVNAGFYLDRAGRLLHRLATTTYHEANPGHHFQITLEQDSAERPLLRRFVSSFRGDAFAEGWGLYAERLADEMGLYDDDYERLGMLHNDVLRAARLVVDTGIHSLGWDRERAVAALTSVGLPPVEAEIEVDRYAVDPGQAVCYKIGELAIRRLRERYTESGAMDSLKLFHGRLLSIGSLPLPSLEREMARLYAKPEGGAVGYSLGNE